MTITEVLKLRKPFKRSAWTACFEPGASYALSWQDLEATDWDIEGPAYMIKQSVLKLAWEREVLPFIRGNPDVVWASFCKALGVDV
jgi:hypothetical protein